MTILISCKGYFACTCTSQVVGEQSGARDNLDLEYINTVDLHIGKIYKLAASENFDEVMKALGIGSVTGEMGGSVSPVVDLEKIGDTYVLTSNSTFVTKFMPGEEFEDNTPDGRRVKRTITVECTTLKEVQHDDKGKIIIIDRIFSAEEFKLILKVDDIVSRSIYKVRA